MDGADAGRSWKVGRAEPGWLRWTAQTRWRFSFHGRADRLGSERDEAGRERWGRVDPGRLSWMRWRLSFHGRADRLGGTDSERAGAGAGAGFTMLRRRACFARALRGGRRVGGKRAML
jgi:hypothetical protein